MSLFCDGCGGLLTVRTIGGAKLKGCLRCGPVNGESGHAGSSGAAAYAVPARKPLDQRSRGSGGGARASPSSSSTSNRRRRDADEPRAPREPRETKPKEVLRPPEVNLASDANLFPHAGVRRGQDRLIADVKAAVEGGRHLVANAPTGLGKTVSSLAPVLAYALHAGKRVFFLTSKQSQHRIAVDTLKAIKDRHGIPLTVADLIAKQDMCPRPEAKDLFGRRFAEFCRKEQVHRRCHYWETPNTSALKMLRPKVLHVEDHVREASAMNVCPHQAALDLATGAHVTVCDYNYFFSDMREGLAERLHVDLAETILIVDEAHNLPDRIRAHLSLEINAYVLEEAVGDAHDVDDARLGHLLNEMKDFLDDFADTCFEDDSPDRVRREGECLVERDEFVDFVNQRFERGRATLTGIDYENFNLALARAIEEYEREHKVEPRGLKAVSDFLGNWRRERRGLARILSRSGATTLHYKILDPSVLSRGVFDQVHASIVMSGTLYPMEMYRDVLGLAPERTTLASYDSPFPPENRLILADTTVTTAYQSRSPEMYGRIAENLASLARNTPGNVAAFFPSYALLEETRRHLPEMDEKEVVVEERDQSKGAKQSLVDHLRGHGDSLLLAVQGGSLSEGYDYEGNLLKGVAIVGLPLAVPTLEVESIIGYYETRFGKPEGRRYAYDYPAMNRVLQAAGRLIRSGDDRGVIVLMDKRFTWGTYRNAFPASFAPVPSSDVGWAVRNFWERRAIVR